MRALCVLHDHLSSPGFVGERLAELGWEVAEFLVVPPDRFGSPGVATEFPDVSGYDLLVPLGAPWSAYHDELIGSWLRPELRWLRSAVAAEMAVLGICFGAQALARALGGDVLPARQPEIGWTRITSDRPDLVPGGPWFQWHYDRITPPPGADSFAHTDLAVQAYRHGRCLGVQFHPEVTAEVVDGWLANGGAQKAVEAGLSPEELRRRTTQEIPAARRRAHDLVDAYLATVFPRVS